MELIDKKQLFFLLNDWNFWKKDLDVGIYRKGYLDKLISLSKTKQIITITGSRRAGKSIIMRQFARDLIGMNIPKEEILMVNFEDPRLPEFEGKDLEKLFSIYTEFLSPRNIPTILFDEIHRVPEWERWVRYIHELSKAHIIISGSNAHLLSNELGTVLTGRHLDLTVFPLSLKEFLAFNSCTISNELEMIGKESTIRSLMRLYLEWGGFPEVTLSTHKQEILLTYFDDITRKDLLQRFKIRKIHEIKALTRFYISNIACPTTFTSLAKSLPLTNDTIEKFSGFLEEIYLIFFLKRFSYKVKEQENSPRKVYCIDTGLANTVGFSFMEHIDKSMENAVFLELKRKQALNPLLEIYYWKDEQHREVDFVVKEKDAITELIQVTYSIQNAKTKEREVRSLVKAMKFFNKSKGIIITDDYEASESIDDTATISYIPLWKWLLA